MPDADTDAPEYASLCTELYIPYATIVPFAVNVFVPVVPFEIHQSVVENVCLTNSVVGSTSTLADAYFDTSYVPFEVMVSVPDVR